MLETINSGVRRMLAVPEEVWHKLERMAAALERTADSAEQHIAEVGALTDAVTTLTQQLNELLTVVTPIAKVEREVADEAGRVAHFFHPHLGKHADDAAGDTAAADHGPAGQS